MQAQAALIQAQIAESITSAALNAAQAAYNQSRLNDQLTATNTAVTTMMAVSTAQAASAASPANTAATSSSATA